MVRFRWLALLGLQGCLLPLAAQAPAWPEGLWTGLSLVPEPRAEGAPPERPRLWAYHQWYCRTLEVLADLERQELAAPAPRPAPHWQARTGPGHRADPGWNLVVEVAPIEGRHSAHAPAGSFR